jgi:hypothetical protein
MYSFDNKRGKRASEKFILTLNFIYNLTSLILVFELHLISHLLALLCKTYSKHFLAKQMFMHIILEI